MKKIGVLLSGCGHRDGSEVHEATIALLAIDEAGYEAHCFSPRGPQMTVRDHVTGDEMDEKRDMMVEAARIARGKIRDIIAVQAKDIDALIIPGGTGAALNLSSYFADGTNCTVHPEVERLIVELIDAKKPIGGICIAPAMIAKVLQNKGINATLTLGGKGDLLDSLKGMGQTPKECLAIDCVIDTKNKIVSTPAYVNANSIGDLHSGISKLVDAVAAMI